MKQMSFNSPIGYLTIFEEKECVVSLQFNKCRYNSSSKFLGEIHKQINEYFIRKRKVFEVELNPKGSLYQKQIWAFMFEIPWGETRTYGQVAKTFQTSPRAVGNACKTNPIPIIIPCHRIMGAKKSLTGYSGGEGIKTKLHLLNLEGYCGPDNV